VRKVSQGSPLQILHGKSAKQQSPLLWLEQLFFAIWDKLIVSPHKLPFSEWALCRRPRDFDVHFASALAAAHGQSLIEDVVTKFTDAPDAVDFIRWPLFATGRDILDGLDGQCRCHCGCRG